MKRQAMKKDPHRDPVCGKRINRNKAHIVIEYKDNEYLLCRSTGHRGKLRKNDVGFSSRSTTKMIGPRLIGSLVLLVLTAGAALQAQSVSEDEPKVPFSHAFGWEKFQSMCAQCHGQWANGTDRGPPLIHRYYVPSHHSDEAFYRAILQGSPMHHWAFGDMPPVSGATKQDAQNITGFLRWLQQNQGLYQSP